MTITVSILFFNLVLLFSGGHKAADVMISFYSFIILFSGGLENATIVILFFYLFFFSFIVAVFVLKTVTVSLFYVFIVL